MIKELIIQASTIGLLIIWITFVVLTIYFIIMLIEDLFDGWLDTDSFFDMLYNYIGKLFYITLIELAFIIGISLVAIPLAYIGQLLV